MINTTEQYLDIIEIDNLISPMSDEEFVNFLLKDRYGCNNIELESVNNLLDMIKDSPDKKLQKKEFLIYKTLATCS